MNTPLKRAALAASAGIALVACQSAEPPTRSPQRSSTLGSSVEPSPRPVTQSLFTRGGPIDGPKPARLVSRQRLNAEPRGPDGPEAHVAPEAGPAEVQPVQLSFRDVEAKDALRVIIGDLLDRSYIIDDDVDGRVTLAIDQEMSDRDLLDLLDALAVVHDWSIERRADALVVNPSNTRAGSSVAPILEREASAPSERPGVRVFRLNHMRAQEAASAIEPLLSDGAVSVVVGRLVLVADTTRQLNRFGRLMRSLDEPAFDGAEVWTYQLANQSASQAVNILNSIGQATGVTRADDASVSFIEIPRTNQVMVISRDPSVQPMIRTWVERLDHPPDAPERFRYLYRVQHFDPGQLSNLIGEFFSDKLEQNAQNASDRGMRVVTSDEEDALFIYATPRDYADLVDFLHRVDRSRQQVFLQAVIAEVVLSNNLRFGVEYFLSAQSGSADLELSGSSVAPLGSMAQTGSAFLLGQDAFALVEALDTESEVSILSTPSLFVRDKAEGTIQVGQEVPVITTRVDPQQGEAALQQEVERRDTGVILEVTPRINETGEVTLTLRGEVTDVVESDADLGPTFNKREISTTLTVPHGKTLLLGGIIREQNTDNVERVPLLGRLPGVGRAFRSTNQESMRTELLLAITPTIANDPADAAPMVGEFVRSAQSLQSALRDFQAPVTDALIIRADESNLPAKGQTRSDARSGAERSLRRLARANAAPQERSEGAERAVSDFLRRLSDQLAQSEREG